MPSAIKTPLLILGIAASGLLILILVFFSPFDSESFWAAMSNIRLSALAGVIGTSVVHCGLTARKWRIVSLSTKSSVDLRSGFYLYSCLIALLGQFLPYQVALITGRSFALRYHGSVPLRQSAGGTVYDQLFDLLIPCLVLLMTPLIFLFTVSAELAAWAAIGCIIVVGLFIYVSGDAVIRWVAGILSRLLPARWTLSNRIQEIHASRPDLLSRPIMIKLYILSCARFGNLILRAVFVAWTLHMDIGWSTLIFCHSAVTFSLLLTFVPGALGVMEWGWIGSLSALGISSDSAAQYALSSRIFVVLALLVLNLSNLVATALYLQRNKSTTS